MGESVELKRLADANEIVRAAATDLVDRIGAAGGRGFSVALSGGRIAAPFFAAFTGEALRRRVAVAEVDFFWADERCVPPDHAESNYRVAAAALLGPLGIHDSKCHRIRGEEVPDLAAAHASGEMLRVLGVNDDGLPELDLVILGMGEDGHVASLFPDREVEDARSRLVYTAVEASKPPPLRISLSYRAIIAAKEVWALVTGQAKASALRCSVSGGATPFGRVIRERARTTIYCDIDGSAEASLPNEA